MPESAWDELGGNVDEAELNRWIDALWEREPAAMSSVRETTTLTNTAVITNDISLIALEKRYKLALTLLWVSASIAFLLGLITGIVIRGLYVPTYPLPMAGEYASANEITGTILYPNENGERRPDVDAVIIFLPKDRIPSPLFESQGIRPGDELNNDTVQLIRELGGMYDRTDANGAFRLQYQEGVRYIVIMMSANLVQEENVVQPKIRQELVRYFRDPDMFGKHSLSVEEFTGTGGTVQFPPYLFEYTRQTSQRDI